MAMETFSPQTLLILDIMFIEKSMLSNREKITGLYAHT